MNVLNISFCLSHTVSLLCTCSAYTTQPGYGYLRNLISVHSPCRTRYSSAVTISRPPSFSSLKITNRSFRHRHIRPRIASWHRLWSELRRYLIVIPSQQRRPATEAMWKAIFSVHALRRVAGSVCDSWVSALEIFLLMRYINRRFTYLLLMQLLQFLLNLCDLFLLQLCKKLT